MEGEKKYRAAIFEEGQILANKFIDFMLCLLKGLKLYFLPVAEKFFPGAEETGLVFLE